LKIVTNAGGVNPLACAAAAGRILNAARLGETTIGVVTGDDLLPRLPQLQAAGCRFENLDTQRPLSELKQPVASANAYLGAQPIAAALAAGARIVITGRVADASLTVGPAIFESKHSWDDWNYLAGVSVAGHLIECGAQVTGGLYRRWQNLNLAEVGYPIAEINDDGSCVITKPDGTGGVVNRRTIIEQLGYEIGDPAHYLTPDVDVNFTTVEVEEVGSNRVLVHGATGQTAPQKYKVSLAYHDGYMASGQLVVYGPDCARKAQTCGEMILQRVERAGFKLEDTLIECLGAGDSVPRQGAEGKRQQAEGSEQESGVGRQRSAGSFRIPHSPFPIPHEVVLRVSARDPRREALERFSKEFAPLITSGPPGLAGYASGRPQIRPVYAYWPTLVPKKLIEPQVATGTAHQWMS
jgi:hypothetical protein